MTDGDPIFDTLSSLRDLSLAAGVGVVYYNGASFTTTTSGATLTNLNAANVSTGVLPDARLSSNVPLKVTANTFAANQTVAGPASGRALTITKSAVADDEVDSHLYLKNTSTGGGGAHTTAVFDRGNASAVGGIRVNTGGQGRWFFGSWADGNENFNVVMFNSSYPFAFTVRRADGVVAMPFGVSTDGPIKLGVYTVATLPTPGTFGRVVACSNARNAGEGAGQGTGSLVMDSGTAWRIPGNSTAVQA